MNTILISFIITCLGFAASVAVTIWNTALYKASLEAKIQKNLQDIIKQRKDFRYAVFINESNYTELLVDVVEIQQFLVKTTVDPKFQIRTRSTVTHPTNSGADFLRASDDTTDS